MTNIQPRHDFYGAIHKALRRSQALLLVDLGRADWHDSKEADRLRFAVAQQLVASRQHLHHEDVFIRPLIEAADGAAAAHVDGDHDNHQAKFEAIATLLDRLALASEEREAIGKELYLAFAAFMAEDLDHMGYEETVIMPLLQAHYSDAELEAAHRMLVSSLPPELFMASLQMMVSAISRKERAFLIGGIRNDAPPPVFGMVMANLQDQMEPHEFDALKADLNPSINAEAAEYLIEQ